MKNRRRVNLCVEELEGRLLPSITPYPNTAWGGYVITAPTGAVTDVKGSWTVPTAQTPPTGSQAATWIGIDGFGNGTVEQIGTDTDVGILGNLSYYAWAEMYPNTFYRFGSFTINPGDHIQAEVKAIGGNYFELTLTDTTTSKGVVALGNNGPVAQASAEWIEEKTGNPLTDFGTVTFSGAQATIGGVTGPIDNTWPSPDQIFQTLLENSSGTPLLSVSSLSDSGGTSSFSMSWLASFGPVQANLQKTRFLPDSAIGNQGSGLVSEAATARVSLPGLPIATIAWLSKAPSPFTLSQFATERAAVGPFFTSSAAQRQAADAFFAKSTGPDGMGAESAPPIEDLQPDLPGIALPLAVTEPVALEEGAQEPAAPTTSEPLPHDGIINFAGPVPSYPAQPAPEKENAPTATKGAMPLPSSAGLFTLLAAAFNGLELSGNRSDSGQRRLIQPRSHPPR
jgi:hypothetical protein